jgi:MFS family permease
VSFLHSRPVARRQAPLVPAGSGNRWGGLLRRRDFRQLWVGETTSSLGNFITSLALPLVAVTTLRSSAFAVGALYACAWLPWLVLGLPAGALVDRVPCRRVMLASDVTSAAVLASVPVAAWYGVLSLVQLLAVAVVTGSGAVFFNTAYGVYLRTLVPTDDLVEANAKLQGSRSVAQVAAPGAAGLLAQVFGAVTGLVADALTFVVSALCLLSVRTKEPRTATGQATHLCHLWVDIRAGLRLVADDPYLRILTVQGALANLALAGWQALEVVFLVRTVGVSPETVGALLAVMGIGGVCGAFAAGPISRRFGTARALLGCSMGTFPFGLFVPMAGLGPRLLLFGLGGAVVSAGLVSFNIIVRSFRQRYCPAPFLGRVTATMSVLVYGSIPLGALLAGTLGSLLGARSALWVMVGTLALCSLVLLAGPVRRTRDLPSAQASKLETKQENSLRSAKQSTGKRDESVCSS